ncbi:glycosyltransferase [Methylomonas sp. SURF-1]|uniref:Glycosyltransferase n=1 Tax=Methylomonas aurea TaxID=2952224 RepID=A0ABT1UDD9_9GAMM|nr:glycosyltransferase [Methylomonas sp. SURF-1]MCQ8180247.1 glycosyltransferase [Methylomonas sp. SURF-1]
MPTANANRIVVVHVITGLNVGGAERMLWKLLAHADRERFDMRVVCLIGDGPVADDIRALGIPVLCLGARSPASGLKAVGRLRKYLLAARPDIVQGWMYHGNFAAWVGRWLIGRRVPLIWGVRQSLYDINKEKPGTAKIIRMCAWLSGAATKILYNSQTARQHHENIGYAPECGDWLPNGFDTDVFRPEPAARTALREELGLQPQAVLVGMVARYDPMKGHANFLKAAQLLAERRNDVHFVLAGRGVDSQNRLFVDAERSSALQGRLHLLGERQDIASITAALDIAVTPSVSEGFANAIGEAMSCAVPCVVTDVGDSAAVLGDGGRVVVAEDSQTLAAAIGELLDLAPERRQAIGMQARQRVLEQFSIQAVAQRYQDLYRSLAAAEDA